MARTAPVIHDPVNPPPELRRIGELAYPDDANAWLTFFAHEGLLIVMDHSLWTNPKTGRTEHLFAQIEYPIRTAEWIVECLRPMAGERVRVGDASVQKRTIDGEELHLIHSSSGGGPNVPGYVLTNTDRRSHRFPTSVQNIHMSDEFLFAHGLFDLWMEVAERGERSLL